MNKTLLVSICGILLAGCTLSGVKDSDTISLINTEISSNPAAAGAEATTYNVASTIAWLDSGEVNLSVFLNASTISGLGSLVSSYGWEVNGSIYSGENVTIDLPIGDHEVRLFAYGFDNKVSIFKHSITVVPEVTGNTYYVDFDGGMDESDGLSAESSWKHIPGDTNAQSIAADTVLASGDMVIFKGGVHYRGEIKLALLNGTADSPIIIDGNTKGDFGYGAAILDGSDPLEFWDSCDIGSPRDSEVFCAKFPTNTTLERVNLYQGSKKISLAQGPNLLDNYDAEDLRSYNEVTPENVTINSIVDPLLTQNSEASWDGAEILVRTSGNTILFSPITGFVPSENKIIFQDLKKAVYTKINTHYSIRNHPMLLDQNGEFIVRDNTIYLLPYYDDVEPFDSNISVSTRRNGIIIKKSSNIIVQGFIVEKYSGGVKEYNDGVGIGVIGNLKPGNSSSNITIRNNEVRFVTSFQKKGAISVRGGDKVKVVNNYVHHSSRNRGIYFGDSSDVLVKNNVVTNVSGTGLALFGVNNAEAISNTLIDQYGIHSNGMSVYLGSNNIFLHGNKVVDKNIALTTKASTNVVVSHNSFKSYGNNNFTIADWGNSENLEFFNNVIISPKKTGVTIGKTSRNGLQFKNNIVDGQLIGEMGGHITNNIYTSLAWNQKAKYGWLLGEGEMLIEDRALLFSDYVNGDYSPVAGSIAINSGAIVNVKYDADYDGNDIVSPFIGISGNEKLMQISPVEEKGLVVKFIIGPK